ncbi:hypothetical protein [Burkholderia sp. MSMB617WGS]|uniref:hypothetical protein n=1 Tax=Burkholderia sp. MSMB617WGS TaxID=1637831 RepID=UPI000AE3E604|nr:hypothetical protein [Burkholderia sp. MSMB617WGS]
MRSALLILAICSGQAIAQVNSSNQVLSVEQSAASAFSIQQTFAMPPRAENAGCVPMVMMGDPRVIYIDPREGHAPAWQSEHFDSMPAFEARSWSAPDSVRSAQHRTAKMQAKPWPDADMTTKRIAESSHVSASETVRQWNASAPATTERSTRREVTVNGKTYREFNTDAYMRNGQPSEPLTFGVQVIFCR